jgi:hypothetical protein
MIKCETVSTLAFIERNLLLLAISMVTHSAVKTTNRIVLKHQINPDLKN